VLVVRRERWPVAEERHGRAPPVYGPNGEYSEDPDVLAAAFTRFENHEGITSLLYASQLGRLR
jgi:hypothetical protein